MDQHQRRPGGGMGPAGRFENRAKPKQLIRTYQRLIAYFSHEKKILFFLFFLVFLGTFLGLISPYLIGKLVDELEGILANKKTMIFKSLLIGLAFTYIGSALLGWLQEYLMAGTSARVVLRLRNDLFSKMKTLPMVYYDTHSHGDIMSRYTNDVDNVSTTIGQSTLQLIGSVITVVGSLVMMLFLSPLLTLGSLSVVPLVFILTRYIGSHTRQLFRSQQLETGQLNGLIEETMSGISVVQSFNQEEHLIKQFKEINERLYISGKAAMIYTGLLMPMMNVINNLSFAIVGLLGGYMVFQDWITLGIVASFLTYSRQFIRPLNEIASIYNTLMAAIAGAERIFQVMDETEEEDTSKGKLLSDDARGEVVFDQVDFGYDEGRLILKDVSFCVKPGKKIALVGPTGAGKTTIVNLLSRFYDVNRGQINIDQIPLEEYNRNSLRQAFGIVLQDTYLFSGSVLDNIRYGRLDATKEAIYEAARLAKADSFIRRLPLGYETILNEGGTNLSQGERQLLTIARAIISKPLILVLDEATSNVDTRTEQQIQEAMLMLMKGRTSFIIAHRLSTIKDADTIMVIDEGRVIEEGNHQALMERQGHYYEMIQRQYKNLE